MFSKGGKEKGQNLSAPLESPPSGTGSQDLELWMVVSCCVGAGNRGRVPCRSSCSAISLAPCPFLQLLPRLGHQDCGSLAARKAVFSTFFLPPKDADKSLPESPKSSGSHSWPPWFLSLASSSMLQPRTSVPSPPLAPPWHLK